MRRSRVRYLASALAVTSVLAGGCTPGDDDDAGDGPVTVRPGAPGEGVEQLDEVPEREATAPDEADLAFVADMLVHHEQALVMTALVDGRSEHDTLPLLAERIEVSQEAEIELLRGYLEAHDHELDVHAGHGEHASDGMPGMLSDEELAALADAEGEVFDRLFLRAMIVHHVGAIEMVDAFAHGEGGRDPEVERLAGHIRGDQESEIRRMEQVLADLEEG